MDLEKVKGDVFFNLSVKELMQHSVRRKESTISPLNTLTVYTGKYTGRSPKDRFIVQTKKTKREVDWSEANQPISEENFNKLYEKIISQASLLKELFVFDGFVGANKKHRRKVRVITEMAYQSLFMHNLLIRASKKSELKNFQPDITLLVFPSCLADPKKHGTSSEAFVVLNLEKRLILVGGTPYCGELKKAVFSTLNYEYPKEGILPMHSSVSVGKKGDSALFLGLSGTGKTALSADTKRKLIGDDEHAWCDEGLFNFEGGCYAKTINLTKEKEPLIFGAIKNGAVVENVAVDKKGNYNFFDTSITENGRVGYPIENVRGADISGKARHPKNVIFLTADAFAVLPVVSRLDEKQAVYHFLSGYTSRLGQTEVGLTKPKVVFSKYFGAPFMPHKPEVYAKLFEKYIKKHKPKVWLLNTGWFYNKKGEYQRVPIEITRRIVEEILSGRLNKSKYQKNKLFNLFVPENIKGISKEMLSPSAFWKDKAEYEKVSKDLVQQFKKNFRQFKVSKEISKAGFGK